MKNATKTATKPATKTKAAKKPVIKKKTATKIKSADTAPIVSIGKASVISNKQKREYAFDLFLNTEYPQKQIAELVGVSEKTIGGWKTADNWDELKAAEQITSQKIIRNIYNQMSELTQSGQKLDADKLVKAARAIEALSNQKTTISQVINVFKDFTTWLFTQNPTLAKEVNSYQQKYITQLLQA